jgi:phage terminase small subunit
MIDRAVAALDRGEFLQEFIPVPEDLKIVAGRVGDDDNEAQKKLVEDTERNIKEHGYGNWYDYCVNEWGTKWDVGDEGSTTRDSDTAITTSFDSAWSPPIQAYEKLVEMGFSVRAYYYEPGMNFAGIWDNG